MKKILSGSVLLSLILVVPLTIQGGERKDLDYAQVVNVRAVQQDRELWRFDVTVRHNDEGWEHYADRWEVVSAQGEVLATRVLAHPHQQEQPFTRSLSGILLPASVTEVVVRAHDSLHGFGGAELSVPLGDAGHVQVPVD